jgi:BirA family biotin operon repressor/biotin-[acetyl-CoA-carboxylase] ligase
MDNDTRQMIRTLAQGDGIIESDGLVDALSVLNLKAYRKSGLLYLCDPVELLQAERIQSHLTSRPLIELHWTIGSTNTHLMELRPQPDSTIVCLAERQEAGKGRRGKAWVSPFGKNIYLSVGTKLRKRTAELGGLSLVIGIQVIKTLRNFGLDKIGLKWPNDVLLLKGKLAGILVELKREHQDGVFVVIGIGINFELEEKHSESIDQPWSELKPHISPSRNDVAGQLVNNMLMALEVFEHSGFSAFRDEWNESNLYRGREVIVHLGEEQIPGRDAGVDDNGNLLLETSEGMRVFAAGQVSLRPAV